MLRILSSQLFLKGAAPCSAGDTGYRLEKEHGNLAGQQEVQLVGLAIWALVTWPQGLPFSLGARVISLFPGTSNSISELGGDSTQPQGRALLEQNPWMEGYCF